MRESDVRCATRIYSFGILAAALGLGGCTSAIDSGETGGDEPDPDVLLGYGPITGLGGKCLDAKGGANAPGTPIIIWTCHGGPNQLWHTPAQGIAGPVQVSKGLCLGVNSTTNGSQALLLNCASNTNQTWTWTTSDELVGPGGKCLDVRGAQSADGTAAILYPCHGGPNQTWHAGADLPPSGTGVVPKHVPTWDRFGATTTNASIVRTWVTFEETQGSTATAAADCHADGVTYCYVTAYVDTNLIYTATPTGDFFSAAAEDWFLHEPSPHQAVRVTTTAFGGGYLLNQNTAASQSWWQNFVRTDPSTHGADWLFMDDQSPGLPFYGLSSTSSNEITTTAQYQAAHAAMSAALTNSSNVVYPQVDNTIPDCGNPFESAQGVGTTGNMLTGGVHGLLAEGCPESNGTLTGFYPGLLDDAAWIDHNTTGFIAYLSYGSSGSSQPRSRRIQQATVMLGYDASHYMANGVSWADLEQENGNLSVWPEQGIVPTGPIQSMGNPSGNGCLAGVGSYCSTGGHNDLEVTAGIFRREFSDCYNQGISFGKCAVIVNTTGSPVTVTGSWLTQSFGHQITFAGGDVQSGGTVNLTGPFTAGSTAVAAADAILLAP